MPSPTITLKDLVFHANWANHKMQHLAIMGDLVAHQNSNSKDYVGTAENMRMINS